MPPVMTNQATCHWQRVREFMEKADQEIHETPTLPSEATRMLRARLILEEALETIHALGACVQIRTKTEGWLDVEEKFNPVRVTPQIFAPDLEAIADGCADLSVVNIGTLISCGIKDDDLLHEVDANNIRKFHHICPQCSREYTGDTLEEAVCAFQPLASGIAAPGMLTCLTCQTEWRSGYRREDGKWVKPENHKPPRIEAILQGLGAASK